MLCIFFIFVRLGTFSHCIFEQRKSCDSCLHLRTLEDIYPELQTNTQNTIGAGRKFATTLETLLAPDESSQQHWKRIGRTRFLVVPPPAPPFSMLVVLTTIVRGHFPDKSSHTFSPKSADNIENGVWGEPILEIILLTRTSPDFCVFSGCCEFLSATCLKKPFPFLF